MNLHTKLASGLLGLVLCAGASGSFAAGSNAFDVSNATLSLNTFSSMTFVPSRVTNLASDDTLEDTAEPGFLDRSLMQSATSFEEVERAQPLLASGEMADPLLGRKPANSMAELLAGLSLMGFVFSRRARLL